MLTNFGRSCFACVSFGFVFSFLSPSGICFGISIWRERHGGFSDLMLVPILIAPLFVISFNYLIIIIIIIII